MPHNHSHDHHHIHKFAEENIRLAFFLNFGFAIAEMIGGLITNSVAITADALHDFGDSINLAISWQLERLSNKTGDKKYSYGYKRFSLLSALISAIVLIVGSLFVAREAILRLMNPQTPDIRGMLVFALVGIAVNGYAALKTSHGENLNSKMISWHMMEDVLGWVGVLIVSIVMYFTDLNILDPILSILITCIVLFNVIRNLNKTLSLFLQAVPDKVNIDEIEAEIKDQKNVKDIHHTHVWSLDGEHHVLTTHVVLCQGASSEDIRTIKAKIRDLADHNHLSHTTVEFEYIESDCSMPV